MKMRKEAYDRAQSDIVKVIRKNAAIARGLDGETVLLSLAQSIEEQIK